MPHKTSSQVVRLAELGVANGLRGVVASPQEISALRESLQNRIIMSRPA